MQPQPDTLEGVGVEAKPAVPELIKALESDSFSMRVAAAKTLGMVGAEAEAAVPALIRALDDKEVWVRKCAAIALGRIGTAAEPAITALSRALKEDPDNTVDIAKSLCAIDAHQSRIVLPFLDVEISKAPDDSGVRFSYLKAIALLGEIGEDAKPFATRLVEILKDDEPVIRFNAAWSIWRIDSQRELVVVPVLMELSKLDAYRKPEPQSTPAVVQELMEMRDKRESYHVRLAAIGALWQISPKHHPTLRPLLIELLKDWQKIEPMKGVIPEEKAVVPAIVEVLRDETCREIHPVAQEALRKIGGTGGEYW